MAVVVVYGGGFQPFHAGHLSGYIEAKQAFPDADFYVAASNDTKTRPIPFDDKKFLAQQAGVTDNFAEVKLPIRPTEILDRYNPNKDIFILVRSERDPVAYTKKDGSPGYYQPYVDINKCEPMGQHGYVFVTHKKDFKLNGQTVYSGTQVRDMYANSDDRGRINIINQLYPQSTQQDTIKKMLDKYIGTIAEPVEKPVKGAIKKLKADKLKEHIQRIRPLLHEANNEQKLKLLKLMKAALTEQGLLEGKYKCSCHPGDADPDCPVHGLEPMEVGDALDVKKGVAEGSGKNVVKSIKVGNFKHDLVDTGMGWQVRIYNGDELYDTGLSKNSEQKGLAALEDAVAYTEKQTRSKRQGVAESNDYLEEK